MYEFVKYVDNGTVPFAVFVVSGESIYEVATYYQRGLLRKEFIKVHSDNKLIVAFATYEDYKFQNIHYLLHLTPMKIAGYVKILGFIPANSAHIPSIYRMKTDLISTSTMNELFRKDEYWRCNTWDLDKVPLRPTVIGRVHVCSVVANYDNIKEDILPNNEEIPLNYNPVYYIQPDIRTVENAIDNITIDE